MQEKTHRHIDIYIYHDKILTLFHNYTYMSGGHEHGGDHGHEAHGSNSTGKTIELGITSMIAGFFGMASGA